MVQDEIPRTQRKTGCKPHPKRGEQTPKGISVIKSQLAIVVLHVKKSYFSMRICSFLLNFAQKKNKIIQQWTLDNLFERLKATIMRNDFLQTIIIIGLIALACLIIYTVGKCTGKFFATI